MCSGVHSLIIYQCLYIYQCLLLQVVCGAEDPVSLSSTELYYVCSGLPVSTPLSVTVWAVNGAGAGEMVTVNTATACQGQWAGPVGGALLRWLPCLR